MSNIEERRKQAQLAESIKSQGFKPHKRPTDKQIVEAGAAVSRNIFTRRGNRWSPDMDRLPEPCWLSLIVGTIFGAVFGVMLWVAL